MSHSEGHTVELLQIPQALQNHRHSTTLNCNPSMACDCSAIINASSLRVFNKSYLYVISLWLSDEDKTSDITLYSDE